MNKNTKKLLTLISLVNTFSFCTYAGENNRFGYLNINQNLLLYSSDNYVPFIDISNVSKLENTLSVTPESPQKFHALNNDENVQHKPEKKFDIKKFEPKMLDETFILTNIQFPKNVSDEISNICKNLLIEKFDLYKKLYYYSISKLDEISYAINNSKIPYELKNQKQNVLNCIREIKQNASIDITE